MSSLHAALEMEKEGKYEKASKLFRHAVVLAPKHPDILNRYGEFVEEAEQNIMMADQLYFQALTYCPDHVRAFTNRQRTATVVEEMDRSTLKRIDGKRDLISAIPDTDRALIRAKKEAYFQVIGILYIFTYFIDNVYTYSIIFLFNFFFFFFFFNNNGSFLHLFSIFIIRWASKEIRCRFLKPGRS